MYAKSMAEARGATHTTPGTLHRPGGNAGILDELCDKLMASTLRKTIRQSRVAPINAVMQDIKLNLNGQFAECLEVCSVFCVCTSKDVLVARSNNIPRATCLPACPSGER